MPRQEKEDYSYEKDQKNSCYTISSNNGNGNAFQTIIRGLEE